MKSTLALIAFLVFSFQLQAQVSFTLTSSPGAGSQPTWVASADVNGDGKTDLICANAFTTTLTVLTNNGSGGFAVASSPGVGNNPNSVVAADVNGDGKVDLISANYNGSTLSVLTNNGSGGFATAGTYPVGQYPRQVTTADVNADGKVDLICANEGSNTLSVLTNSGSGGFVLSASLSVGSGSGYVAAADVNGDGKVDLISANYNANTLSVLTNNGSGGFVLAATPSVGSGPRQVATADVNGDGKVDLIDANFNDNTLTVLTNNGSGGFVLAATPNVGNGPSSVVATNLSGTARVDLVCVNFYDNTLSVLTNTGSSFVLATNLNVGSGPWLAVAADVNGDTRLDLVCANSYDNTLSVLMNTTPALPNILVQPLNQAITLGSNANFSVTAGGSPPLSYQWRFGGTNIVGATNTTLTLTNVQLNQAGNYAVLVTNLFGSILSSNAMLTVTGSPPAITLQPTNQTVSAGGTASFTVAASGTPLLSYQWRFGGTNIAGATNATLTLTNVQFNQAGNYAVLVTNLFGSMPGSNAVLTVTVDHFTWSAIPSPRYVNTPFGVSIQARDLGNGLATNFTGTAILTSTNGIAVTPPISGSFIQGVWTGSVMVAQTASNLVLRANDGLGHAGLANPINVFSLPTLTMTRSGNIAVFMWPVGYTGFLLETTANLSPAAWSTVPYSPVQFGSLYVLPLDMAGTNGFYRLRFPGP